MPNNNVVDNIPRPNRFCAHFLSNGKEVLIGNEYHYLLECPQTADLRNNRPAPNMQDPESIIIAAKLVKNIIDNIEIYEDLLTEMPPPR